jgi:hypothetical protein
VRGTNDLAGGYLPAGQHSSGSVGGCEALGRLHMQLGRPGGAHGQSFSIFMLGVED